MATTETRSALRNPGEKRGEGPAIAVIPSSLGGFRASVVDLSRNER